MVSSSSSRPRNPTQQNWPGSQVRPNLTGSSVPQQDDLSMEVPDQMDQEMLNEFYFNNQSFSGLSVNLVESKLMNKNELKQLKKKRIGKSSSQCIVCYEQYASGEVIRILPCGHFFHYKCLKPWFKKSSLCPLCRTNIKDALRDKPIQPLITSNRTANTNL